jgi:hypothetical protein
MQIIGRTLVLFNLGPGDRNRNGSLFTCQERGKMSFGINTMRKDLAITVSSHLHHNGDNQQNGRKQTIYRLN